MATNDNEQNLRCHLHISLRHEGERVYLLINTVRVGYWVAEDFELMEDFERRFMARDFTGIILPWLRYVPAEGDEVYIEAGELAKQAAFAELDMRAQARAQAWKAKADEIPPPSVFSMVGQRNDVDYIRYIAKAEEAAQMAGEARLLARHSRKGGIIQ